MLVSIELAVAIAVALPIVAGLLLWLRVARSDLPARREAADELAQAATAYFDSLSRHMAIARESATMDAALARLRRALRRARVTFKSKSGAFLDELEALVLRGASSAVRGSGLSGYGRDTAYEPVRDEWMNSMSRRLADVVRRERRMVRR